jgi:hypothetical protein
MLFESHEGGKRGGFSQIDIYLIADQWDPIASSGVFLADILEEKGCVRGVRTFG